MRRLALLDQPPKPPVHLKVPYGVFAVCVLLLGIDPRGQMLNEYGVGSGRAAFWARAELPRLVAVANGAMVASRNRLVLCCIVI